MVLLGDKAQVEARCSPFGDSANLDAYRCMVCVERTIGSKIIFDTPEELIGDVGHLESCFLPFGDSVGVATR